MSECPQVHTRSRFSSPASRVSIPLPLFPWKEHLTDHREASWRSVPGIIDVLGAVANGKPIDARRSESRALSRVSTNIKCLPNLPFPFSSFHFCRWRGRRALGRLCPPRVSEAVRRVAGVAESVYPACPGQRERVESRGGGVGSIVAYPRDLISRPAKGVPSKRRGASSSIRGGPYLL